MKKTTRSFVNETTKTFILSAAATAGMVAGFLTAAIIGKRLTKKN